MTPEHVKLQDFCESNQRSYLLLGKKSHLHLPHFDKPKAAFYDV